MQVKYIEQDWYQEEPEIYDEELQEVCVNLECSKEDLFERWEDFEYLL